MYLSGGRNLTIVTEGLGVNSADWPAVIALGNGARSHLSSLS